MSERARLVATGLPAGAVSTTASVELTEGWTLTRSEPGAHTSPADLSEELEWRAALVPGTVAQAVGPDDLDRHDNYDASDWWYRCRVPRPEGGDRVRLRLDGLATLSEVWVNGERVLESSNMFSAHEVDVTDLVAEDNEIAMVFRSLEAALAERRPRPRWKTKLVENQQLRWFRTTLLGRIPGWTPAIRPVGPWRPVWLESVSVADVETFDVRTGVIEPDGTVAVAATMRAFGSARLRSATLQIDGQPYPLEVETQGDSWAIHGDVRIPEPELWWPATHGEPALHDCNVVLQSSEGDVTIDCGRIGFKDLRVDRTYGRLRFMVNGVPVFCRGSCWTNNDIVSLVGSTDRMRGILELAAGAHANMIRVGGTMVYETDDFYRACDELGLMVWQDFMFANMDYPVADETFAADVRAEADQQLRRLARHASLAALCGGSEVEQQAAMFGAPKEAWSNEFFSTTLPELIGDRAPGTPYWPSTPTGGVLPFHVGEGLTHYYGVGAYKRPLNDVRLVGVKFTPECLGFSNVPEASNLRKLTPSGAVPPHHPDWKAGVPRDTGPGWDFEDIRDFYLEELYGIDAVRLRGEDLERYLELSRVVTGEVMESVFAEWRRDADPCGGALTWFLNDLRPGAGWGVIDRDGEPKAALHHLGRVWAPCCVRLLDRGLDGTIALIVNERPQPLQSRLDLMLVARGGMIIGETDTAIEVSGRDSVEIRVEDVFGHFLDSTYSYRFGPPRHEAIVARLLSSDDDGVTVSEDVYRPNRAWSTPAAGLDAKLDVGVGGDIGVRLRSDIILYDVRIDIRDHRPSENHFCLTPGQERIVALHRVGESTRSPNGYVSAINLTEAVRLDAPA